MTHPAQTTTIDNGNPPKLAALGELTPEAAVAEDNMRRLWRQEQTVREAEDAHADAKASVKEAKKLMDQEFDKLRRMIAEFADPEQLA